MPEEGGERADEAAEDQGEHGENVDAGRGARGGADRRRSRFRLVGWDVLGTQHGAGGLDGYGSGRRIADARRSAAVDAEFPLRLQGGSSSRRRPWFRQIIVS